MASFFDLTVELEGLCKEMDLSHDIKMRDVLCLLALLREFLEYSDFAEDDKQINCVNMYCHWVLHKKLSLRNAYLTKIVHLNESLIIWLNGGKHIVEACYYVLDLDNLRSGLVKALSSTSISFLPVFLRDCDRWDIVRRQIFKLIYDKPITFPESVLNGEKKFKSAFKIYEKILNNKKIRALYRINAFSISFDGSKEEFLLHTDTIPIRLETKISKDVSLPSEAGYYIEIKYT